MNLLAIDPGFERRGGGCACACFRQNELTHAWFRRPKDTYGKLLPASFDLDLVVVEQPQQDRRSRGVPPAHLIRLAWDGALLAGLYAGATGAKVKAVTPFDWKGSEPKPVQHARLWRVLSPAERAVLGGGPTEAAILKARKAGALERWAKPGGAYYPRAFIKHNLLDAVAIGCVELERLKT